MQARIPAAHKTAQPAHSGSRAVFGTDLPQQVACDALQLRLCMVRHNLLELTCTQTLEAPAALWCSGSMRCACKARSHMCFYHALTLRCRVKRLDLCSRCAHECS